MKQKSKLIKYALYTAAVLLAVAAVCALFFYSTARMNFANPKIFYFAPLLLLVCIAGAALKHYFRPALKYPLPTPPGKQSFSLSAFTANWLGFALICLAMFLCLTALARPRGEGKTIIPPSKGIDIMMVIDISQSMLAMDFNPNRITAAVETAESFVARRASDRIGVIVFDDIALLQCPLTLDYAAVKDYIRMVHIGMTGGRGSTAIGDAVALAAQHLKTSAAKSKVIILLTDGENNAGAVDPMAAAKAAQAYGIKIHTIAVSADTASQMPMENLFGTTTYVSVDPISDEGAALLMEMAKITGGEFFRARNNLDLETIYARIDALEKTEFDETAQINYKDLYKPFLAAAIILLLLALALDKFIFIKIP